MQLKRTWHRIWTFIQQENLHRLTLLILGLVVISAIALSALEPDLSFADSVWWSIVTLTTVGYGDIAPNTFAGRIVAIVNMIMGVGLLAILSATLASLLVNLKLRRERGMGDYTFKKHIILCEWNSRAAAIIKELRMNPLTELTPIIIIANIDYNPSLSEQVYLIKGNVNDDTLTRASIQSASTVIILGDDGLDDHARDAKVIPDTTVF